jgi:hypothetical protein
VSPRLEHVDVRCSSEGQRLLVLCLRVNSPVGEIAQATGIDVELVREAVAGRVMLGEGSISRVGAWLSVVWLRHAARCGRAVDVEEWADAVTVAARLGVEVRLGASPHPFGG